MGSIYDRLLIAAAFFAVGFAVLKFMRLLTARNACANLKALRGRRRGASLVLFFTSPNCGICKAAQAPALKSLQERYGQELQVITISVDEDMETARHWKVMTLPTTFVFNAHDRLLHHNIGYADAAKLLRQLNEGKIYARKLTGAYVPCEKN